MLTRFPLCHSLVCATLGLGMLSCGSQPTTDPAPTPVTPTAPNTKPDIVLVVIDTLRADHLGVYGHSRPTSPNIDQMAQEGMWFSRAYAQSGWTLASFSSLFTGMLPHEHCVGRDSRDPTLFGILSDDTNTLAELLSAEGYATAAVMNNTFLAPMFNIHQGFGDDYLWEGARNDTHRSAAQTVSLGLEWLQQQDRPAFLVVHMMEPHLDYFAPEPHRGTFLPDPPFPMPLASPLALLESGNSTFTPDFVDAVTAAYDEEILAADAAMSQLRSALAARDRPTYTVVTADHGEEFWDHGGFEHGHTLFSELTRVPLIITGPELPTTGRVDGLVQHIDLFETLATLGGATPAPHASRADLFALVREGIPADRAIVNENTLYGPPAVSLINQTHRLSINQGTGTGSVWEVNEQGQDVNRLNGQAQIQQGREMMPVLESIRGSLEPCQPSNVTQIQSFEIFDQLRALGYLPEADTPPPPPSAQQR